MEEPLKSIYPDPKPEPPRPLAVGDYLKRSDSDEIALVASAGTSAIVLIHLPDGSAWSPVSVGDPKNITRAEADAAGGALWIWSRIPRAEAYKRLYEAEKDKP